MEGRKNPHIANSVSRLPQRLSSTAVARALFSLASSRELLGQIASPAPPRLSQEPLMKWSQVVSVNFLPFWQEKLMAVPLLDSRHLGRRRTQDIRIYRSHGSHNSLI